MAHNNQNGRPRADLTELPVLLWLWLPLAMAVVIFTAWLSLDTATFNRWFLGELAIIELFTPLLLLPAIACGIKAWSLRAWLPQRWLSWWILVVILGCVYFAGEEVSWGQHFFGWQTPDSLERLNDQQETNLHNISSWLDQKPRFLLELFVLIGGVLLPAWRLTAGEVFSTDSGSFWFWPACVCLPSALLAILVYMPDRLISGIDYSESGMLRLSEIQELFYAVFLFIYTASIAVRLRRHAHQAAAAPPGSR